MSHEQIYPIFGDFWQITKMTKAQNVIAQADKIFKQDLRIQNTKKEKLIVGCFNSAISHHQAITLLLSHGMDISALSLMRSLNEALIRGYWLLYCANDNDVSDFGKRKFLFGKDKKVNLKTFLTNHDTEHNNKHLYSFIDSHNEEYHDFTHCGKELSEFAFDIDDLHDEEIARHFNNANKIASFAIEGLQILTQSNINSIIE